MRTDVKRYKATDTGLNATLVRGTNIAFLKAILSTGYNEKTVSNATNDGNFVTLDYGVAHGYVLERVLQITGAEDSKLNGEHVIIQVTANTVTIELKALPAGLGGVIKTKVAPLGFNLVYEATNLAIFEFQYHGKIKYLRIYETPLYSAYVNPSVSDGFDPATGLLTGDVYPTTATETQIPYKWDFAYTNTAASVIEYPSIFGTSEGFVIVGQFYSNLQAAYLYGIQPWYTPFDKLDTPIMLCSYLTSYSAGAAGSGFSMQARLPIVGNVNIQKNEASTEIKNLGFTFLGAPNGNALPAGLLNFNPIMYCSGIVHLYQTNQPIGIANGIYRTVTNANTASGGNSVIELMDEMRGTKVWLRQFETANRCVVLDAYQGFD
ncbi:hypothetical protein H0S57_08145 [Acinetobacter johnsonii]|uniref:hypothetical protein n=1 Tax=Acinetobacter johnsonii TaxID=40214 RepID=UPI0018A0334D|nr:hypothetical protein [Acinetobacter johnsonii]QPF36519.1 hypothetical protein H0S57_08145 [Acinetobacter johnsonii]